jgi:hypothetical protein
LTANASYGDGQAMRHLVQILGRLDFWNKLDQKVFYQTS